MLPDGAVLVVGSGQSGCQIAEDLHLAGRKVHLCVGDAPRVARRYRGKDVVEWLHLMGYYDLPVHEHPLARGRARQDQSLRHRPRRRARHRSAPARASRAWSSTAACWTSIGDRLVFDDDLAQCLDQADQVSESIKTSIDGFIAKQRHLRSAGTALSAGLDTSTGAAGARLSRGRHHLHRLVHRISHRLQLDRFAGLQRAWPADACARRDAGSGCVLPRPALALYLGLGSIFRRGARRGVSGRVHQGQGRVDAAGKPGRAQRSRNRIISAGCIGAGCPPTIREKP